MWSARMWYPRGIPTDPADAHALLKGWALLLKSGFDAERALFQARIGNEHLDGIIAHSALYEEMADEKKSAGSPRAEETEAKESPKPEEPKAEEPPSSEENKAGESSTEEAKEDDTSDEKRVIEDILAKVMLLQGEGSGDNRSEGSKLDDGTASDPQVAAELSEELIEPNGDAQKDGGDAESAVMQEKVAEPQKQEEKKKSTLEDLIDWLLSEGEYCAHALLMANGNVRVNQAGRPDTKFLWAPRGHRCLTQERPSSGLWNRDPVEQATARLTTALDSMKVLFDCASVRSRKDLLGEESCNWKIRYAEIVRMAQASAVEVVINFIEIADEEKNSETTPLAEIKPFYQVSTGDAANRDLFIVKNGLAGYVEALNSLLDKTTGLHWNLNVLNALIEASEMICDYDQVRRMIDGFDAARKITDIRVAKSYVKLFRISFGNLSFTNKKRVVEEFYDKYGASVWHDSDEEFGTNLTLAMKKLSAEMSRTELKKLAEEMCWFFMLSVKWTWWKLLVAALRAPEIVPNLIELMRQIEPVRSLRVNDQRLVLVGIRRLLEESQVKDDLESAWIQLVVQTLSEAPLVRANGDGYTDAFVRPLVDTTEGVATTILALLHSHPRVAMLCLVSLLNNGSSIVWSSETPMEGNEKTAECIVNAAELFTVVVDAFYDSKKRQDASGGNPMPALCWGLLGQLSKTWKCDGVKFPPATIQWIETKLEKLHWSERYCALGYLNDTSSNSVRRSLPTCFFEVFGFTEGEYRKEDCDDWEANHDKAVCALKGLFRLAAVADGAAYEILEGAAFDYLNEKMKTGELDEPLKTALMDALSNCHTLQYWRVCTEVLSVLLDKLITSAALSFEASLCSPTLSTAMQMMAPAAKLCDVVSAMIKKSPVVAATYTRNLAAVCREIVTERIHALKDPLAKYVAWHWLASNFCRLVKASGRKLDDADKILRAVASLMHSDFVQVDSASMALIAECSGSNGKDIVFQKLGSE